MPADIHSRDRTGKSEEHPLNFLTISLALFTLNNSEHPLVFPYSR